MTTTVETVLRLTADGALVGPGTDKPAVVATADLLVTGETTQFTPARSRWTSSSRAEFPTVGRGYHEFEAEIVAASPTDHTAIVTKWVNRYRQQHDNVTRDEITRHRTRLQAFVTAYNAAYP